MADKTCACLKKTDFAVKTNDRGIKYVTKISDELTKNHREDNNPEESGSMYETGGPFCPVASFEKYLQHLNPNNEFLFLRPKKEVNNEIWYDNMVVGERMLANKMKEISTEAKLSHIYTNHSIRATSITLLDKAGFEARHIMTVSGHIGTKAQYAATAKQTRKPRKECQDSSQLLLEMLVVKQEVVKIYFLTPTSKEQQLCLIHRKKSY